MSFNNIKANFNAKVFQFLLQFFAGYSPIVLLKNMRLWHLRCAGLF